jgi:imidazolonepropionase
LAGREAGLLANFHGDELSAIAAAELGAEVGAAAVSHLEHVSEAGMDAMAAKGVVATLLPTTAYVLRIAPPPARKMIERGVAVALGSDFNPNAHTLSMPLTANLACVHMGLTLPQALNAMTLNAAASLRRAESHGTLAKGKVGDFILLEAPRWEHLIYQMADPPVTYVFKRGKMVFKKQDGTVLH